MTKILIFSIFAFNSAFASSPFVSKLSTNLHFGFNHFQQQVKSEIGGVRGERLIHQTELSSDLQFFYQVIEYIHLGWYLRYDMGNRNSAKFSFLDEDNKTVVQNELGGDFWELWTGPVIRPQWKWFFAEFGYGLYGVRSDGGRYDVPDDKGNTNTLFELSPQVAWISAIGTQAKIYENLNLSLKIEYRARYYSSRDGEDLFDDNELGTQNFTPLFGINYQF